MDKQFGPYRLVRQIATGGMAEIYLAKTKGIGGFEKFVALKLIHPNFSEDEHFIEMLIDEAKISVQLQHVNIAQIFDLGRHEDTYYITMEYIDGTDLFRLLRTVSEADRDFPIEVACYIAKEVCSGLDYAHRRRDENGQSMGIVHRDVSPQNVLLSHAGEVKIVDFGIAKAALRAKQTAVGVIKGKYYYMSPEQAWGDPVDHRTDIFSAGILLYEMLVGQMLYLEDNVNRLLDMVRKADIPPPSSKRKGVTPELDSIVMRALRKKAGERYPTAQDFQIALERFIYSTTPNFSTTRIANFLRGVFGAAAPSAPGVIDSPPAPAAKPPVRGASQPPIPRAANISTEAANLRHYDGDGEETTGGFGAAELVHSRDEFEDENSMIFRMAQGKVVPAHQRARELRDARELTPAVPATGLDFVGEKTQISAPPGFGQGGAPSDDDAPTSTHETALDPLSRRVSSSGEAGGDTQNDMDPPTLDIPVAPASFKAPPMRPAGGKPQAPLPQRGADPPSRGGADRLPLSALAHGAPAGRPTATKRSPVIANEDEPRFNVKRRKAAEVITGEVADDEPTRIDAKPSSPPVAPPYMQPPPPQPPPPSAVHVATGAQLSQGAGGGAMPPIPAPPSPSHGRQQQASEPPRQAMANPFDFSPSDTRPPGSVPLVDLASTRGLPPRMAERTTSVAPLGALMPEPPRELPAATPNGLPGGLPSPIQDPYSGAIPGSAQKFNTYSLEVDEMPAAYKIPRNSRRTWAAVLGLLSVAGGVALGYVFLRPKPSTTAIMEITSQPLGAMVSIDGKPLADRTPVTVRTLARGRSYHLVMEMDRYERWDSDQEIGKGQGNVRVVGVLRPITGTLRVTTIPAGATVTVNAVRLGEAPVERKFEPLPPPSRFDKENPLPELIVQIALDGYKTETHIEKWEGRRTLEVNYPMEPTGK